MKKLTLLTLCVYCLPAAARADDFAKDALANWHQWRGPLATGFSPDGDPPTRWDDKTNIKWKAALPGRGSSTPIVWGDQVFVLAAVDTGKAAAAADIPKPDPRYAKDKKTTAPKTYHDFLVLSFDRTTGKLRWQQTAVTLVPHEGHHPTHSYAAGSPTTDGKRLYVSFGSHGLFCYDLGGKLLWQRDLGTMHTRYGWGEGISPVVHGEALLVNWDNEAGSALFCLDAATGKTKWQVERDEPTSWATPLVVAYRGKTQVIVNATNRVRSYDLADGKLIWQCGGMTPLAIPSPVSTGETVVCMSGYRAAASWAVPLDATGDLTGTNRILWRHDQGTPYVPSPLLADGRLWFTQGNVNRLSCLDAKTGKVILDQERLPSLTSLYASPAGGAGRIYVTGRDGTTLVLKQGDKLEVLATNRLSDPIDASPAIVGKQLFLRGEKYLYCIETP